MSLVLPQLQLRLTPGQQVLIPPWALITRQSRDRLEIACGELVRTAMPRHGPKFVLESCSTEILKRKDQSEPVKPSETSGYLRTLW